MRRLAPRAERSRILVPFLFFAACEGAEPGAAEPAGGDVGSDAVEDAGAEVDSVVGPDADAAATEPEAVDAKDPGELEEPDEGVTDAAGEVPEPEPGCAVGDPCDDGDPCTVGDSCVEDGGCAGLPMTCDDGLDCTKDSCEAGACDNVLKGGFCLLDGVCVANLALDPSNSCRFCDSTTGAFKALVAGAPCDDGDACTKGDLCEVGSCVGKKPVVCEGGGPCTTATCDPAAGCVETPKPGGCEDGDACTLGDACAGGACVAGPGTKSCLDDDECTSDTCHPKKGCVFVPDGPCLDGDPCTKDACFAGGFCVNEPFEGPCEDGDLCTGGEFCSAGVCSGAAPVDCDDQNACTTDSCDPEIGCRNLFGPESCNDGYACTEDDVCAAGACVGTTTDACPACKTPASGHAAKVNALSVSEDGFPGHGLDVDGDPTTCAPEGSCAGGVDNALAILSLVNGAMNENISAGILEYVADLQDLDPPGEPGYLPVWQADQTAASASSGCDAQNQSCAYEVLDVSFDGGCNAWFSFDDAVLSFTSETTATLTAGGPGHVVSLSVPLFNGNVITFALASARLEATVTLAPDPASGAMEATALEGLIGGAIPKSLLLESLGKLDEDSLGGLDPAFVAAALDGAVEEDVDLDGDGLPDAASLALQVKGIGATLSAP